jgi:hypothetical protein
MDYLNNPQELIAEVGGHQIEMERICMATFMTMDEALDQLIDYALHVGETDRYPVKRINAFYGFERWLRNAKRFKDNRKKTGGNGGSQGGLVI